MRVLIVGAGAVGGYFGGRLAQASRDVTFLVRPNRAEQIQSQGLRILSPSHGDFTARPKAITASQISSPYDVIFLSVKGYDLAAAMDDFVPAVGPHAVIVPVLNGMLHLDLLTERFGRRAVLGGVCYIASQVDSQGRIVQLNDTQKLIYGELDRKKTARIEAVHQTFQGAGFDASISESVLQEMWQKWVFLASVGAITCLLRGNIGEIAAVPGGADLSLAVLHECTAIADACGYPMPEAYLAKNSSQLTALGSSLTSSMYRDLKDQARVEVDTILSDFLERGRQHRVSAPLIQAACVSLTIYEQGRVRVHAAGR